MRVSESCAKCLYDRQASKTDNQDYLDEIRSILNNRKDTDCSPYMVYLFNKVHVRYFGKLADYKAEKKQFNDLVLSIEDELREKIRTSSDPIATSLMMARIGNYIDLGAMNNVDKDVFMDMFTDTSMRDDDVKTYESILDKCGKAKTFLLVCDNSGKIVLDKLMLEQLKLRFPDLKIRALVRGGEVLNDATMEDACYTGLDKVASVIDNGEAVAGTIYGMMSPESKEVLDNADIILSKGQGNYESMSGQGRHAFYMFLCKCDLFTGKFNVPRLTGIFIVET